jgi:AraC-like DNA-binding protein
VIGVHFRPGGAAPFFAGALSALHNRTELLDALWGPAAAALRERLQHAPTLAQRFRLVEDALLAHGPTAYPLDGRVLQAVQMLGRDPSVARVDSVQRASGYSPQQFIRRFDSLVGITPKRFYDQSHLIHEFRLLAGITPARYVPAQSDQPSHVPLPELQRL